MLWLMAVWGLFEPLVAQWQELDFELAEQVNSGWLSRREHIQILDHVERTGPPIAVEEAWAIDGLTHGAVELLMNSAEWQRLVNQAKVEAIGKGQSVESRYELGSGLHSIRLRNPGKWGLRWDRTTTVISGYFHSLFGRSRRWNALIGGHRLGWGNRTLVGEGGFYTGLDAPSFALPVQYGFVPSWSIEGKDSRRGIGLHRDGNIASTLSLDIGNRDFAAVVCGRGQSGIIARMAGGNPSATVFAHRFWGMHHWIIEAGRLQRGWAWSGACQWMKERDSEARLKFEALKPDGRIGLDWEASVGGEWRVAQCIFRWHVEWENSGEFHPIWLKFKREWPGGQTAEVQWRAAQSRDLEMGRKQRLEFRGQWKSDSVAIRFLIVPFADAQAPGAVSAFLSCKFGNWRLKQSYSVWAIDTGRRAYISEPNWSGSSYRMITGTGHRLSSVVQCEHPTGLTWLLAVVRSNVPTEAESVQDMLTLTSAQTELRLSLRLSM